MSMMAAGVVLAAIGLDHLIGEPPTRLHPVALFGRLVGRLDRAWRFPRLVGVGGALGLPLVAAGSVALGVGGGGSVHPVLGGSIAAGFLFSTISLRLLCSTAGEVITQTDDDIAGAREALLALAGRDATELSAAHVRSAAVESAAENLSDGFVAPLAGFGVASVAAGWWLPPVETLAVATAAAAWIKAVNTMDSMVGYRSKPVGWAAARLDDLVMWLPARLTALALSVAALSPDPLLVGRRWAGNTVSPNAGWPMATLAAAVGVRLEKPGHYTLNPVASPPTTTAGHRGVTIVRRAGWLTGLLTAVIVGG
jgi:adenosylcobinamide-phosphate synthase